MPPRGSGTVAAAGLTGLVAQTEGGLVKCRTCRSPTPPADTTAADGLDEPTSLAFGTGRGNRKSVFISNRDVLPGVVFDGEDFAPGGIGQSVVKVDVGVPGWPLP